MITMTLTVMKMMIKEVKKKKRKKKFFGEYSVKKMLELFFLIRIITKAYIRQQTIQ